MTSGWESFGKTAAVVAGLAVAGGIIYGIGTTVYNSGQYNATEESEKVIKKLKSEKNEEIKDLEFKLRSTKEKHSRLVKKNNQENEEYDAMVAEGRVIPEDSCFRYGKFENNAETVRNHKACTSFSAKLDRISRRSGKINYISTDFFGYKTNINPTGIGSFEKQRKRFIEYQRK
jgi:hypothetical protein